MKTFGIVCLFIVFAISAPAQETPMHQLYRNILTQPDGSLANPDEIDVKVNEVTVRKLSQAEVSAILPLAFQCAHSPNAKVREAGIGFLFSVMMRFDSAQLLGPYIDDLGKLVDEVDPARRQFVLSILGGLNPKLPDKAFEYLMANLQNSRNSIGETVTIAVCLLRAAPTDPATVHKVLVFASARSDADLTNGVLSQLGLSKIRLTEAVDFISANLNQEDKRLRASAVVAASRLDKETRTHFSAQLSRIASDPAEDQYVRGQAASALKP
jgi:hypothetical protein